MSFDTALAFTLAEEGGAVNNPSDPGGLTYRGVTQRNYDDWRFKQGLPMRLVTLADDDEIKEFYRQQYWLKLCCPQFPENLDMVLFDSAVLMGQGAAALLLQEAAWARADGVIGPDTIGAVNALDWKLVAWDVLCSRRLAHLSNRKSPFITGWLARLDRLRKAAYNGSEAAQAA